MRKDLTGNKYGKLTVLGFSHQDKGLRSYWLCECECGRQITVEGYNMKSGHTSSCGCNKYTTEAREDLTGLRFGSLVVLGLDRMENNKSFWKCRCDCGNEFVAYRSPLISGQQVSCSKCSKARVVNASIIHGMKNTPEYRIWTEIKTRCYNPNRINSDIYHFKGIRVCDRWLEKDTGFVNFYADMGPKPFPDAQIDRIDNDGNYTPENCRWATRKEQCNNRSNSLFYEYKGERLTIAQLSEKYNICYGTLYYRLIKHKWDINKAIEKGQKKLL